MWAECASVDDFDTGSVGRVLTEDDRGTGFRDDVGALVFLAGVRANADGRILQAALFILVLHVEIKSGPEVNHFVSWFVSVGFGEILDGMRGLNDVRSAAVHVIFVVVEIDRDGKGESDA